jgi:cell division septation protein DedD
VKDLSVSGMLDRRRCSGGSCCRVTLALVLSMLLGSAPSLSSGLQPESPTIYSVQLGVFSDLSRARGMQDEYNALGLETGVFTYKESDGRLQYRVLSGNFRFSVQAAIDFSGTGEECILVGRSIEIVQGNEPEYDRMWTYSVQVASHRNDKAAYRAMAMLETQGLPAHLYLDTEFGNLYRQRLLVGHFVTFLEADDFRKKHLAEGETLIVRHYLELLDTEFGSVQPIVIDEDWFQATETMYTIQVASFRDQDLAWKRRDTLTDLGFRAFVDDETISPGNRVFRLNVGLFHYQEDAEDFLFRNGQNLPQAFVRVWQ